MAAEAPTFEVVRAAGDLVLWKSVTRAQLLDGFTRPARTHFHLTEGDALDCHFMSRLPTAMINVEAMAGAQAAEVPA